MLPGVELSPADAGASLQIKPQDQRVRMLSHQRAEGDQPAGLQSTYRKPLSGYRGSGRRGGTQEMGRNLEPRWARCRMLTRLSVVTSQYVHMRNHCVVHPELTTFSVHDASAQNDVWADRSV